MILVCGHNNAWQLTYRFDAVTRGAVNRVREVHRSAAGKGVNVARVLAALQVPATLLAYLGGPNGMRVRRELEREGIPAEVIDTAPLTLDRIIARMAAAHAAALSRRLIGPSAGPRPSR